MFLPNDNDHVYSYSLNTYKGIVNILLRIDNDATFLSLWSVWGLISLAQGSSESLQKTALLLNHRRAECKVFSHLA